MRFTLTEENADALRFAAQMTGIEPAQLLNGWVLKDQLQAIRDPRSGALRDLIRMTAYSDPAEFETVKNRVADWERAEGCRISEPLKFAAA